VTEARLWSYPSTSDFPFRVTIDNHVEWEKHWEISAWCRDRFGDETHCITWRHALSGSPSRADPEFSTWLFMLEEDAVMFRLVWS
jgi:hypothetical protein